MSLNNIQGTGKFQRLARNNGFSSKMNQIKIVSQFQHRAQLLTTSLVE